MSMEGKNHYSYAELSDEQLVAGSEGDIDKLGEVVRRYLPRIRSIAGSFPAEVRDDLVQEGLIAFLGAVKSYDEKKGASFATYASVCVRNRMISSLERNAPIPEEEREIPETADKTAVHPEEIIIERESADELYRTMQSELSELEWSVFRLFIGGMSYDAIAERLGVTAKAVDNAVQRARRKLRLIL